MSAKQIIIAFNHNVVSSNCDEKVLLFPTVPMHNIVNK